MTKQQFNTKRGFTIIEVVLVLAIAGLIFMMVFLALPALQRSQRDTQRRDNMSEVTSQLQQYQSNNRGAVPANDDDVKAFLKAYLNMGADAGSEIFLDPDGTPYTIAYECGYSDSDPCTGVAQKLEKSFADNAYTIRYYTGAKCDGESVIKATGKRNAAIQYKLEGAGVYCANI